jgi:hypothetical protein
MSKLAAILLTLVILLSHAAPLLAQGAAREDRKAIANAVDATFSQIPRASELPPIVDLRPHLPPVGSQTMNDCAAWAYAYAARSYLEAIDQGWKPDRPERIFSPTFIYNQVNKGKDSGSSPLDVLNLMRQKGTATLATQPYLPKDFTTAPRPASFDEASQFRIASFTAIEKGPLMRQALAEGNIVLVGVRTNPVFSSGRYDIYTRDLHEKGQKQRQAGQPHGFHAMVVCGYSDHKKAFLFMNSWGAKWGQAGFIWVAYDVADKFNLGETTEELVDYAILMRDRREPVVLENGKYKAVELKEMQITATPRFTGLEKDGQPRYDLLLELIGPAALQNRFQSVRWSIDPLTQPATIATFDNPTDAKQNYALTATTTHRSFKALATVKTTDGQTVTYSRPIQLPQAVSRDVSLNRIDSYFSLDKKANPPRPLTRWTLTPQLSEQDWADLDHIEWTIKPDPVEKATRPLLAAHPRQLTPLPAQDKFTYISQTPGAPSTLAKSLAYPSGISDNPPAGEAVFKFRDGTVFTLPFPKAPFPLVDVNQNLWFENTVRPIGKFANQEWYFYEVRARYPESWDTHWDNAYFILYGQGQGWLTQPAQTTRSIAPAAAYITGHAPHSFDTSVVVNLLRGQPPDAFFRPPSLTLDQLFSGQNGTVTTVLHENKVVLDNLNYDIRYCDRYLGMRDGKPHWLFDAWIDGFEKGGRPDQGTWTLPSDKKITLNVYGKTGAPKLGISTESDGPLPLRLAASRYAPAPPDAQEIPLIKLDLAATLLPRTPINNAITLLASEGLTGHIGQLKGAQPGPMVFTQLAGPLDRLRQVHRIDYIVPLLGGRRLPLTIENDQLLSYGQTLSGARFPKPPQGQTVDTILYFIDNSVMVKRATPAPQSPLPILPLLQLEAASQYLGIVDSRPAWRVSVALTGDAATLALAQSSTLTAQTETAAPLTPQPGLAPHTWTLTTHQPLRLNSTLTFKPEAQTPPVTLDTIAITLPDTIIHKPRIRKLVRHIKPAVMDPNAVDIWENFQPGENHCSFFLQASLSDMANITQVTWKITDPVMVEAAKLDPEIKAVTTTVVTQRSDGWFDGFPLPFTEHDEGAPRIFEARLHLNDGKTIDLPPLTSPINPDTNTDFFPTVALDEIPYGKSSQGKEQRLLTASLKGQPAFTRQILRLDYTLDRDAVKLGNPAGSSFTWPGHFAEYIIEQPTSLKSVQTTGWAESEWEVSQQNRDLPAPAFANRPQTAPAAGLTVAPSPADPSTLVITPDLPLSDFENIASVHYIITLPDKTITHHPIALLGPPAQRFSASISTPLPNSVQMIGATRDNKQITLASWPKSGK